MEVIHGYTITQPFSCQDAGTCMWGFCSKNGHEFFIKKFLQPRYPLDQVGFSEKLLQQKIQTCEEFCASKRRFYSALCQCATGNLVIVRDFFREGSSYYAVSEKIHTQNISMDTVCHLDREQKITLLRQILFSISRLHREKIIHADIKPDNFLLKKTKKGFYTAKIIDFDAGFFENDPPDDIQGDPIYLAPEAFLAMDGEHANLTTKVDIFALGILFHQYLTGAFPKIPEDYQYTFEAVLDDAPVTLSPELPAGMAKLIQRMLSKAPEDRPSAQELFDRISPPKPEPPKPPAVHPSGFHVPTDFD